MGEKVVPIRAGMESGEVSRREPLRQVFDYLLLPSVFGLHTAQWLGGKAIGVARKNIESTLLALDSHKLGSLREVNRLPDKVQTIENDILDINKKEHKDKPKLIAFNAVSWYKTILEYHRGLIQSGEKTSQDYVNQLLSIHDEAGVPHEELISALSDTWVESPIAKDQVAKELLQQVRSAEQESAPTSP